MKKKGSLALFAALFAVGALCMNRLSAEAAGEQAGQEQNAKMQDGGTTIQEEIVQPMAVQGGTCGENVTWTFDEGSGTLTISGSGPMEDMDWETPYDSTNAPWNNIKDEIKSVVIQEGVTGIGACAFGACKSLESVIIPSSVTEIGAHAFFGCSSLTSVAIPSSVTEIRMQAFYKCSSLTDVKLSDSLTMIDDGVFFGCANLKEIRIPEGVTTIWLEAFYGCSSLTEVVIPASVTVIYSAAFGGCSSLKRIYFSGKAPDIAPEIIPYEEYTDVGAFNGVAATIYYTEDPSWNIDTMQDYGGKLTWVRRPGIISEEAGVQVTDKIYVIGSGTDAAIKCSGAAEDFVSLAIDGEIVDPSYYKVESGSTVLTVLSAFLDKLAVGDHTVTLNYTYDSVDTVLTIVDKQADTEKPGNTTDPATPTKPADNSGQAGQTGAANQQTGVRKSPQTGEPQTEESWSVFATVAVMACIGGAGVLVWRRRKSSS